jgi:2'-5' RNA ligase
MRLFTAVDPSPEVRENLERLLARLRPTAHLKWSGAENIHLTLKFIGEWPEDELPRLKQTLAALPVPEPFEVRVAGLGFFPNARAPRVFWVGVQAPPALVDFARAVDQALAPLGIAAETRAYSPHLTLARVREGERLEGFRKAVEPLTATDFGAFQPDRFSLYQSRTSPAGSVYVKLEEYPWRR